MVRVLTMEVTGVRGRGLARRWKDVVDYYMRVMGFEKVVAMDREVVSTPASEENGQDKNLVCDPYQRN